ncbi:hypothetical protein B0H34DRAFT_677138 [Crassisporium funariophilum]|nr:hypothetical protein B0H34DRAFT_677138 [Crassisporium funariophilum]
MSDKEKAELNGQVAKMQTEGYPDDIRQQLAHKNTKKWVKDAARNNWRKMVVLSISFVASVLPDGRVAVELHNSITEILGAPEQDFADIHNNLVQEMCRLVRSYIDNVKESITYTRFGNDILLVLGHIAEREQISVPSDTLCFKNPCLLRAKLSGKYYQLYKSHQYCASPQQNDAAQPPPLSPAHNNVLPGAGPNTRMLPNCLPFPMLHNYILPRPKEDSASASHKEDNAAQLPLAAGSKPGHDIQLSSRQPANTADRLALMEAEKFGVLDGRLARQASKGAYVPRSRH